ncbi:superoxide dismutase family protein [Citricoccus sp. NPDC055426]|uniref:superoxide dismutase family protein n=1 Tax=Citricoccus sp. NPDC055426 TaxID=3155536 RepID=UPI0034468A61
MLQHTARKTTLMRTTAALLGLGGLLAVSACSDAGTEEPSGPEGGVQSLSPGATAGAETTEAMAAAFTATLQDADGDELGTAEFSEADGSFEIRVEASGLEPGFYGLHVHGIGECEPDSAAPDDPADTGAFKSAGGHLGAEHAEHPDHAGDLPVLLVQESGDALLTFQTNRISLDDFEDEDGAALMLHSDPDNFANIPERYAADGPDEDTTGAGDSGDRLACGVIEPAA